MRKKIVGSIAIVCFLVFSVSRLFFFHTGFLEQLTSIIVYPFLISAHALATPLKNYFGEKRQYHELKEAFTDLQQSYETLLGEHLALQATKNFHESTAEIRAFRNRYQLQDTLLAKILVKNVDETQHYYLIDKGSKQGAEKNMIALYASRKEACPIQLLGSVIEVFPLYSKIRLITDRHCNVSAYTAQTKSQGITVGTNVANTCSLSYVSHLAPVTQGELVISSGLGLLFPEGYCLGTIRSIETKGLCHTIELSPLIVFNQLEYCLLIKKEKSNVP